MALPAMISEMGQQQLNYGAAVGQSLIALGQQVGQQLATREYQRQAQAALPALQQTYSSALDKIQAGDVSAGYRDLMNAQLQFGATQNPFLTTINDRASKLAEDAANNVMKTRLYEMQYGGRGGGGATRQTPPNLLPYFEGEEAVDFGATPEEIPAGGIVEAPLPEQGPAPSAIAVPPQEDIMPEPMAQPTPVQKKAASAAKKYFSLTPAEQATMDKETTYSMEELKNNYEIAPVAGLSRFIPGATGVGIPNPTERKKKRIAITNEGKQSLSIEREFLDETTNKAKEFASNLAGAVSQVESSADAMKVISDAGGINKVTAKKINDTFYIKPIQGDEEIEIDEDTFRAIDTIKGARAIGAASSMPIIVGRYDFASVEEAEASGLPSGTIVYIGGRKARID